MEASEPVTPAAVEGVPAVRVGQMEVREPGVEVHPNMDSPKPPITTVQRTWLSWRRIAERCEALGFRESDMNEIAYFASPNGNVSNGVKTVAQKIALVVTASAIGLHALE